MNIKFKASLQKPFKVFADDFDSNGTLDIVLSKKYKNDYVPVRGKECSSQQMPFIKEKFPTYNEFASASLADIYGEKLSSSYQLEATEFRSVLLLNKGEGVFEKVLLPAAAQAFPILTCAFYDVNRDGYQDAILAGNIFNTEVETPRLDGGTGLVLFSDKKKSYTVAGFGQTGLYIPGNTKSLRILKFGETPFLIAGRNDDLLSVFRIGTSDVD